MTHEQLRLLNTPWPCRRRLLSAPLPAATSLWVRHSTSLWRAVPLYQKDADGRYRIKKEMPKPTMPTRVEGCTSGARKKLFKHGCVTTHAHTRLSNTSKLAVCPSIVLPDGYFIPWLGKPHHEFLEFWRAQVRQHTQSRARNATPQSRLAGA